LGVAESEHGIFNSILRGHVDFSSEPWSRISHGAKDLVRRMLHSDPKQRISAYDVLSEYPSLYAEHPKSFNTLNFSGE
jgi:serine/threonine protein kinase